MAVPETSQSPPAGLTEMEMAFLCEQLDNHGDKPLFRDTGLPEARTVTPRRNDTKSPAHYLWGLRPQHREETSTRARRLGALERQQVKFRGLGTGGAESQAERGCTEGAPEVWSGYLESNTERSQARVEGSQFPTAWSGESFHSHQTRMKRLPGTRGIWESCGGASLSCGATFLLEVWPLWAPPTKLQGASRKSQADTLSACLCTAQRSSRECNKIQHQATY